MKTIFLFVLAASFVGMVYGQQTAGDQGMVQKSTGAAITIGSENYWIGGDVDPWLNEDYKFSADPGKIKSFKVYPNPSAGEIHIDGIPNPNHDLWILQLGDIDGRLIYSTKLDPTDQSINLPNVSRGNYVIKFMYNQTVYTSRITLF
jgi:hypothetical protein